MDHWNRLQSKALKWVIADEHNSQYYAPLIHRAPLSSAIRGMFGDIQKRETNSNSVSLVQMLKQHQGEYDRVMHFKSNPGFIISAALQPKKGRK